MKSKKTRERILDAALELFNEKKASNVSTVQISAAMKISPGNLYYYYTNKEEIIRCIWNERMIDSLNEMLERLSGVSTAEEFLDYIEGSLEVLNTYRFFYTEMPTLFTNDRELIGLYRQFKVRFLDAIGLFYETWNSNGDMIDIRSDVRKFIADNYIVLFNNVLSVNEKFFNKKNNPEELRKESILHVVSFVVPYFTDKMKADINREIEKRNYLKAES